MGVVIAAWRRLPVIARAVVVGSLVVALGTLPWGALAALNSRLSPAVPWSVPVMALYLWFYWRILGGEWWPGGTADSRREYLRARPIENTAWRAALLAGGLGWAALLSLRVAFDEFLDLPRGPAYDGSTLPAATVALHVLMTSAVAGVAEEAGFRGYMQAPIERRHGAPVALLLVGTLFWLAHSTHYPGNGRLFLLHGWFYLAASALLGVLAHRTGSILPCIVIHAAGDVLGFVLLACLTTDAQGVACAAAAIFIPAAIWAGSRFAQVTRTGSARE